MLRIYSQSQHFQTNSYTKIFSIKYLVNLYIKIKEKKSYSQICFKLKFDIKIDMLNLVYALLF